ncbi:CPK2 [Symbiodinium sp. CCMP2456]|nr:CPK2 [Symbiodinium sp. CCMP2456]
MLLARPEMAMPTLPQRGVTFKIDPSSPASDATGRSRRSSTMDDNRKFDAKAFMPKRVNAEISRRYDIDKNEIGSGGYGKVFVARDRTMRDRMVAIKKVIIFEDAKKKAFLQEAQIMKDLDHPNICKLLETYEQGRFMFFVMEYCEGREVFDRIMEQGLIQESTTAEIVRQAASALLYAHNRGIAHRDMKPENICFCSKDVTNNHVKLIDWGLGFYFGQGRMNSAVGSLTYAAPEVLEAKEKQGYTAACDLWSLGVVTYVMLCGKPPFWGNYNEQLRRMKRETFPMSDATWQQISRPAKDLIRGLLRADPKQRMKLEDVLRNPWLRLQESQSAMDNKIASQVLTNLRQFSRTSQFFTICVASVARQLDHKSLRDVHKVFAEMDTNGDGVLELHEVRAGFQKFFGRDSPQVQDVEQVFQKLDLDGSGFIDYTEFCAAGIGERVSLEEDVLWAAFKAFDVQDDDGRITKEEVQQVLRSGDVNKLWTPQVCQEVAEDIFETFDQNGDGSLDFQEFVKLMRECSLRHKADDADVEPAQRQLINELTSDLKKGRTDKAYDILTKLDDVQRCNRTPTNSQGSRTDDRRMSDGGQFPQQPVARTLSSALRQMSWNFNSRPDESNPSCFACTANKPNCSLM